MVGVWLVTGMTLAVMAASRQPHTVAEPFELRWEAPAQCPERSVVSAKIRANLASSVPRVDTDPILAEARVVKTDHGYMLTLRIAAGSGVRTLVSRNCAELAEAVAFMVSLTVDPTLRVDNDPPSPAKVVKQPPPPQPPPPQPPPPQPTPPRRAPAQLALGIDGGAGLGALPQLGGNVGATIAGQFGHGRAELTGRYALPQSQELPDAPTAGATFQVGTVAVRGCGVLYAAPFEFPLCGGIELGAIRAAGVGIESARVAHRLWAGVNVGPSVAVVLGPIALRLGVEATTLLVRPRFEIEGAGVVHRLGPAHGRALLGIELRWPTKKRTTKSPGGGK